MSYVIQTPFSDVKYQIKFELEWNEGLLFRRWCKDNHSAVRKYKFYKKTPKEVYEEAEVPIWDEADLSLLSK